MNSVLKSLLEDGEGSVTAVAQGTSFNRREVMKGGAAGAATLSLTALAGRAVASYSDDYGPIAPVADQTTGLSLISLPEGFEYFTYGWTGQPMLDGNLTPKDHDGMGVVAAKGNQIVLVRNHELSATEGVKAPAVADYHSACNGGTTNVLFDAIKGKFLGSWSSLSGTIKNCSGGITPWGSWISCEETTETRDGVPHGWCFDVPGFGVATGQPLKDMGRFSHEAVAVDPVTSFIYETEDATPSAFYQFRPNQHFNPASGGKLYALKVVGEDSFNFSGGATGYVSYANGTTWDVEWVEVTDAHGLDGRPYNSAPGRASFARGEGCFYDSGKVYFTSTSGGGARRGQVFSYDTRREQLTMIFESRGTGLGSNDLDSPDNIAVSPRGGILLMEDGGSPNYLRGLTPEGGTFVFAENIVTLSADDISQADAALSASGNVMSSINPGNYRGEWAGGCFHNEWLFVNIQSPGITFAIKGPWNKGSL